MLIARRAFALGLLAAAALAQSAWATSPPNDNFAARQAVALGSVTAGSTISATHEASEPPPAASGTGVNSVWYTVAVGSSPPATLTLDICDADFDSTIEVFTGTALANLQPVDANDDNHNVCGNPNASEVEIAGPTANTTYVVRVDAYGSDETGSFHLFVDKPHNDDFASSHDLGHGAQGTKDTQLEATNVFGTTEGSEPGAPNFAHSLWYTWTAPTNGPVAFTTCGPDTTFDTRLGAFTGSAVNALSTVATNDDNLTLGDAGVSAQCGSAALQQRFSYLRFAAVSGTTYHLQLTGYTFNPIGTFDLYTSPNNDNLARAQSLSTSFPSHAVGTTVAATGETGEPGASGLTGGASVWYRLIAGQTRTYLFNTCGSGDDTELDAFTGATVDALTPVASGEDGDAAQCGTASEAAMALDTTAGTTYYIRVRIHDGTKLGWNTFQLNADAPANDGFARATDLTGPAPADQTIVDTAATKQTGEPKHAGNNGGHSVWYRYTPVGDGTVTASTCNGAPGFNTVLGVYTAPAGTTTPTGLTEITSNNDATNCGPTSIESSVSFQGTSGQPYYIAVDGFNGITGTTVLHVTGPEAPPAPPQQQPPTTPSTPSTPATPGVTTPLKSFTLARGATLASLLHGRLTGAVACVRLCDVSAVLRTSAIVAQGTGSGTSFTIHLKATRKARSRLRAKHHLHAIAVKLELTVTDKASGRSFTTRRTVKLRA